MNPDDLADRMDETERDLDRLYDLISALTQRVNELECQP